MSEHECCFNLKEHTYDETEGYYLPCTLCGEVLNVNAHSWDELVDAFGINNNEDD